MKKVLIIVTIFIMLIISSCSGGALPEITLKGENSVDLAILVDKPNYAILEMTKAFASKLEEYTGKSIEICEISEFNGNGEIYPIYIDTVKEDGSNLPDFNAHMSPKEADMITWVSNSISTYDESYEIVFRESDAQIIAPDEYWLYFALEDFLSKFEGEYYSVKVGTRTLVSGNLAIPTPAQLIERVGDVQFLFTEYKTTFVYDYFEAEEPGTALLTDGDGRDGMQGGCSDGKYAYYALYEDEVSNIYKFDLETWELVAVSEAMPTGHSNDITYIPDKNVLLVAGSTPTNGWFGVSYVDAETLEYLEETTVPYSCGGVSYVPQLQQYVIQNFYEYYICDKDFNLIRSFACGYSKDTDQGLYSDGTYIYDSRWGEKDADNHSGQNHLLIHDMNGNFISHGEIHGDPCDDESENENVFIHNNMFQ